MLNKYRLDTIVITLIYVCYFGLYKIIFIPQPIRTLSGLIGGVLPVLYMLFYVIYFQKSGTAIQPIRKNFGLGIYLLWLGLFTGALSAQFFHGQSMLLSLWVSDALLYYAFYFYLHQNAIKKEDLEKVFLTLTWVVVAFFYIQTVVFPMRLFDTRMAIDRGTLRLFLPGMGLAILSYFYYLNRFFKEKKIILIVLALGCYSIFILQATRQVIGSIGLLTVVNILVSKQVKSKLGIMVLMMFGMVALFFIFQDLFMNMFDVTNEQGSDGEDSVREQAVNFFLTELFPNKLSYLLGNAQGHIASPYGQRLFSISYYQGYYLSDIGIVGDYVKYGAFFVIGGLIILFRALFIKVSEAYKYVKYFVIMQLFTLFTSRGIFGSAEVTLITILYLIDLGRNDYLKNEKHGQ